MPPMIDLLYYMGSEHNSFTPRDEHSQGEHPHNSLRQLDCTYKLMLRIKFAVCT